MKNMNITVTGQSDFELNEANFREAKARVDEVIRPTPLVYSPHFSHQTGYEVYLKPENMQLTGAYKIRGAYYKLSTMSEAERALGLITASAGNHAQGLAFAAQRFSAQAHIVMPETTPLVKVNNTKSYGAEVILHGASYDDAAGYAYRLAAEKNYTFVHPFNDLRIACGQGTMAFEILDDCPELDAILLPVGGGGLACGVSTLARTLKPDLKVYGVEPVGAACLKQSFSEGRPACLAKTETIADGVAVKCPGDKVFPYLQRNLEDVMVVSDEELVGFFLDLLERHKMLVENAGLISLAALRHLNLPKGSKVCCVLSGGNMDVITIASLVQHGLIERERVFSFSVLLPDKPGELEAVAHIVAEQRGNIIRLEHNQFVSINRNAAVELRVTLEAFGSSHKSEILQALRQAGYQPEVVQPASVY